MLPQYKMVLVNIILSTFLFSGLIIYRYVLKRKVNLFCLLILISVLPTVSIFRTGSYESGDLSLHTERLMSFYNSLVNYHLIPRWTPEFNAGYGDPHFLFTYFLPYFIGSILHFMGFSFLFSIKLLLALSFIFSGITMYWWARDELGKKAGFTAAVFYLFMPYHLVDMHFRVSIAENLSFLFLPLVMLAIKKSLEEKNRLWYGILSASIALLILSHQSISIMFLPIAISYCLFVWLRTRKRMISSLIRCLFFVLIGLLLSSFYWIPIVHLAQFTQQGFSPTPVLFSNIMLLFYSPWRFGFLFQGHMGELSYLIGYTQIFILGFSIYSIMKNKLNNNLKTLLALFLKISMFLFVFLLPITKPIWENIPLLKYSQFSTRLLVPLALCISILAGVVVKKINKNWFVILLCFLTIFYTILNWGNRNTIPSINDNYLKKEFGLKPDISGLEPTSPIWADLDKSKLRIKPKASIEILKGDAAIKEISRTPISRSYKINAESDVEIKENTLFFPGWIVTANKNFIPINYRNQNSPGVITFKLNKGNYDLNIRFADLPIIIFSKWLSGLSILGMMAYIFFPKKLNFPKL